MAFATVKSTLKSTLMGLTLGAVSLFAQQAAAAEAKKPNILVIMADDIGYWNISAYNRGMMGYRTPNIDRIANEGRSLPTITASSPAPPAAPPSSPGKARCAPAF
jgi:hypothetical protein